jgi:hypothetical protein
VAVAATVSRCRRGETRKVAPVGLRDLWIPKDVDRRRRRFFERHFQFSRTKDRPGPAYDRFLICRGPADLITRGANAAARAAAMMAKSGQQPVAVEL